MEPFLVRGGPPHKIIHLLDIKDHEIHATHLVTASTRPFHKGSIYHNLLTSMKITTGLCISCLIYSNTK